MTEHKEERFDHKTVELDGQRFDSCWFTDCRMIYSGGEPPALSNNTFVRCKWVLGGAALNTIGYLSVLRSNGVREIVDGMIDMILQLPERPESPTQ
jgi:hypothetical protein